MGFYFLGYAYLNMGLYIKAQLTWKDFLALIEGDESEEKKAMREEIEERLADLEEPVLIETGYNCILSNRLLTVSKSFRPTRTAKGSKTGGLSGTTSALHTRISMISITQKSHFARY